MCHPNHKTTEIIILLEKFICMSRKWRENIPEWRKGDSSLADGQVGERAISRQVAIPVPSSAL